MAFTKDQVRPILTLIGKHESRGGDYDIVWSGLPAALRPAKKITSMTIKEVMAWQDAIVKKGAKSTAAGFYQIIRKTLAASVAATGIDTGRKFDAAAQDELAMHLLRSRKMQDFLDGKIVMSAMVLNLAKEWASFPVPYDMRGANRAVKSGQSYYAGDGLNKAGATLGEVNVALEMCRDAAQAAAAKPVTPSAPASFLGSLLAALGALFRGRA